MYRQISFNPEFQKIITTGGIIPSILRYFNPGFSSCKKCGLPWNFCRNKTVYTDTNSGTFATCDVCWENSTLDELKKYYTDVYINQYKGSVFFGFEMEHTLEHLLNCVEEEYSKTNIISKH